MLTLVYGRTTPVYRPGELLTGDVVINATTQCKILGQFNVTVNILKYLINNLKSLTISHYIEVQFYYSHFILFNDYKKTKSIKLDEDFFSNLEKYSLFSVS